MISMSLIHMTCASVKLDADARPSLLCLSFVFEFCLVRLRCFGCLIDVFTDFRLVCNVTSYIYGLHFILCR